MIRPEGFRATAFSSAWEGDARADRGARFALAARLGIPPRWATVRQVHGSRVVEATGSGLLADADGLLTRRAGLPISVATADCLPIAVECERGVGMVHAGWRGLAAGVVETLLEALQSAGLEPHRAAIGPGIGPCCFQVGPEVAAHFPHRQSGTSWGAPSVDLWGAAEDALSGIPVWRSDRCTRCRPEYFSYRRDGTAGRQVAVAWLP
ncbi:MAG: polyphenol oxidase family protein [Actinomycetota bacterium]|nr:polyphenol oxidase family protein [Actinomycetota bacterium]